MDKKVSEAIEAYDEVSQEGFKVYEQATRKADRAFEKALRQPARTYREAVAQAKRAYREVLAQVWREYLTGLNHKEEPVTDNNRQEELKCLRRERQIEEARAIADAAYRMYPISRAKREWLLRGLRKIDEDYNRESDRLGLPVRVSKRPHLKKKAPK